MLNPRAIMMVLERARATAWFDKDSSFMQMDKLDKLIYMVSASLDINNKVYDVSLPKLPITIDTHVAYLGRTSWKLKTEIYFQGHSLPLVHGEQQCVLVDGHTKRPSLPPQWWSDQFMGALDQSGQPLIVPSTKMPTDIAVAREEIKVLPSDADFYIHAGSANYIKFVMDCYIQWHIKKYGFMVNGDPFRNLKSMAQSFKGEANIGDVLTVIFWPDSTKADSFHFHVFKDEKLIHECFVEFFPTIQH